MVLFLGKHHRRNGGPDNPKRVRRLQVYRAVGASNVRSFALSCSLSLLYFGGRLGLDHLVGSAALKPYMHGYFVSLKLYDAARVIANPFAYSEHREKLVLEKLEKAAESRIRASKNIPSVKVNKALAERVRRDEERVQKREEKRQARKAAGAARADQEEIEEEQAPMDIDEREKAVEKPSVLNDPRFAALFEDAQFEVDESTREYALTHPSEAAHAKDRTEGSQRRVAKTAVEEEEDESDRPSSDGLDDSSEEGGNSDDSSDAGGVFSLSSHASAAEQSPETSAWMFLVNTIHHSVFQSRPRRLCAWRQ
jgi:ribosome biogenesis protein ENP2